jgi:hypothetical protein
VTRHALLVLTALALFAPACSGGNGGDRVIFTGSTVPQCVNPNEGLILLAQTVETATALPCIETFPPGWSFAGRDFRSGLATYWLSSTIAGSQVVEVQLLPSCDPTGERFEVAGAMDITGYGSKNANGETRTYVFAGGCVIERLLLPSGTDQLLIDQANATLGFASRGDLAAALKSEYDVVLCGAGASPCAGG